MDEFWTNIEDIAAVPGDSVLESGQIIDLFLDIVCENWDFLVDDEPLVCARLLLNAQSVTRHPQFTRQRLLACIPNAIKKPPQWACFLATVLGIDDNVLELMSNAHVQQLVDVVWMYRHTEKRCIGLYMQLLFVVVMRREVEMLIFNERFCGMLLENMCEGESGDELSHAALKLLSAINHKLTTRSSTRSAHSTNPMMQALKKDVERFHRFGECVIWHFNRHTSSTSQLLTCKLLYQILSDDDLTDILYFNDLKVLVDILLRELIDGSYETERLQELYLLVLLRILQNKALCQDPYKRPALVRVLRLCLETTTNHNIINLANDCLRIPWLGWFNTVHVSPHASRDDLVLATKVESIGGPIESPFGDDMGPGDKGRDGKAGEKNQRKLGSPELRRLSDPGSPFGSLSNCGSPFDPESPSSPPSNPSSDPGHPPDPESPQPPPQRRPQPPPSRQRIKPPPPPPRGRLSN